MTMSHDASHWATYNEAQQGRSVRALCQETLGAAEVRDLFAGMTIVKFDEEDADGMAYSGPKHWHVFHITARQPASSPQS
jgi:hypothetical protein